MDYYFWVKWIDAKKCEHVVGLLYYTNNMYHFRYNKEFLTPANIPKGFNGIPSFGKLLGLNICELKKNILYTYSSSELFSFFKMRIIKKSDEHIWKNYGISYYDECKILEISKAIIPTDSFFVEKMNQDAINELTEEYLKYS